MHNRIAVLFSQLSFALALTVNVSYTPDVLPSFPWHTNASVVVRFEFDEAAAARLRPEVQCEDTSICTVHTTAVNIDEESVVLKALKYAHESECFRVRYFVVKRTHSSV